MCLVCIALVNDSDKVKCVEKYKTENCNGLSRCIMESMCKNAGRLPITCRTSGAFQFISMNVNCLYKRERRQQAWSEGC